MTEPWPDAIYIRDLRARCVIGVYPEERSERQDVLVNITLRGDLGKACTTDCIEDTIDYKAIKKKVLAMVQESSDYLLERLAQRVVDVCFEDPLVQEATVCIDKPGALRFARSVAVELTRSRQPHG